MNILLIGGGVIGSVYAGQFALEGHDTWVLAHGQPHNELSEHVMHLRDVDLATTSTVKLNVTKLASSNPFDLVLVAVRLDQLSTTFSALRSLTGKPHILFLGNNPDGHVAIPKDLAASVQFGFPGISGQRNDEVIEYVHIAQQPTVLEKTDDPISNEIHAVLRKRGFKTQDSSDIDGWLKYHAIFISCISIALLRAQLETAELGNNHQLLTLMCRSIEEGFSTLKKQEVRGAPTSLTILHYTLIRPLAIWYWGNLLKSPKGDLYFSAHLRHAEVEVLALATWVLTYIAGSSKHNDHLRVLLTGN